MKKYTAVWVACFVVNLTVSQVALGQETEVLMKAWETFRQGVKSVECDYTLTTTQYKRKSAVTGKDLYPEDVKTALEVHVQFDFERQEYQFTQTGKSYRTRDKQIVDYQDSTTLKGGKIYGYLAPPPGEKSGVGKGSGSASDLAIIEGGLDSHFIPDSVLPCLFPVGVVPVSPIQNISSSSWHRYKPQDNADLLMPSQKPNVYKSVVRNTQVFEATFEVDQEQRLRSILITRQGKKIANTRLEYTAPPSSRLSGWVRNIYSGEAVITVEEAKVKKYLVARDAKPVQEVTPPAITPGLVVARIPTLDGGNDEQAKPPVVNKYVANANGDLIPAPNQTHAPSYLRCVLGSVAVLTALWCVARLFRIRQQRSRS